jgi:UDPglucose 6-dehydrogenase
MRVCVLGLWHLGTVTAACLASAGHQVTGLDFDLEAVKNLANGRPPLFEPGLEDLIRRELADGNLQFSADMESALRNAEVIWVAYDTPVDEEDRADVGFVFERVTRLFPHLRPGMLILISSQVPVGTTREMEDAYAAAFPAKSVTFAYSPENLRMGEAIQAFSRPERVVVGLRSAIDQTRVSLLLRSFTENIVWMSVESAEMTKHALNTFLATSVAYINELAVLCEKVGADAKEVERGLKTDPRIGLKAYLSPGAAFAGGTLARDVNFLSTLAVRHQLPLGLIDAVQTSNETHKSWTRRKLEELFGNLQDQRIAVWGLTYKPGTDTLRRSSSVELCRWLIARGAQVAAHDPAVKALTTELGRQLKLCPDPLAALQGAKALVIATEWADFQNYGIETVLPRMAPSPVILDPNRFLFKTLGHDPRLRYVAVGIPAVIPSER